MAAEAMGSFGYGYSRYTKKGSQIFPSANALVWVNKRYTPIDLRMSAPVPRAKFVCDENEKPAVPTHWEHNTEQPSRSFSRHLEDIHMSWSQALRGQEWSTLKQTLPFRGVPERLPEPRWGTGARERQQFYPKIEKRFPHINSPMTRFADDMHLTNRLFKLH